MRKNNKGFTLIEVLVAITIMGIITVMALPGVQQLQSRNRERKYEKYGESLVSSAKLYVDSNEEDIFGYALSGCADITYKELETKALAKDYETNGVTCAGNPDTEDHSDDTFIHVVKKNDKYVYQPYITCTDKNGKVVYQTPHTVNMCDNTIEKPGNMEVNITAASNEQRDKWTKEKQINVEVSSEAGLTQNNFSAYCLTSVDNPKVCVDGSRKTINFGNASGDKSVQRTVSITGLTGEFYFVLLAGEGRISDLDANQYSENVVSDFTIKIDNTPPNIYRIVKAKTLDYRLQIFFDDEPEGSKINKITYAYDNGEEQPERCDVAVIANNWYNRPKKLDCNDIYSGYITTAFTVNKDVDVTFKVYDEAGNSASYKTHVGIRDTNFDLSGMYLTYTDSMGNEYEEGTWTNKTLHALEVGGATENRPIIHYEISKNGDEWEEFKYDKNSDMYVIQPNGKGETRYLRAVTDDYYCSEAKKFKIKFDATPPEITFDPDTNRSRKKQHTVKVKIEDSQSGPRSNCKIKYGWTSDKKTAPATYKEANFGSNTSISVTGSGPDFGLSILDIKFYYLWVLPEGCYDTLGNSRTEKAVAGPFSFRG